MLENPDMDQNGPDPKHKRYILFTHPQFLICSTLIKKPSSSTGLPVLYTVLNQQRSDLCKKTVIQEACECEFSQCCGSGSKLISDSIASADPDLYSESVLF